MERDVVLHDLLGDCRLVIQVTIDDFSARLLDLFAMLFPSDKASDRVSFGHEQVRSSQ